MNEPAQKQSGSVLVVLSGGMDSTVCAALAVRDFGADAHRRPAHRAMASEPKSASSRRSRRSATGWAFAPGWMFRTPFFRAIGGSALTDETYRCPESRTGDWGGDPCHLRALPQRAFSVGGDKLGRGAGSANRSTSARCSRTAPAIRTAARSSTQAFNEAIRTGTKEGRIRIETPLIALRKAEIVMLGLELGAPFDLTWSCYSREDQACGVCDSCVLRLRAFAAAGASDPIPYVSPGEVQ